MEIKNLKENANKVNKTLVLISLILILQIYQITNTFAVNYQLKKDPSIKIGETSYDFCTYSMKSLIEGDISWRMFDEETYKALSAEPDYFHLNNEEKIKTVKVTNDQCRVVTEYQGQLRGFIFLLSEDIKNPYFYKIISIEEDEPPSYATTETKE